MPTTKWVNETLEAYAQLLVNELPALQRVSLYQSQTPVVPATVFADLEVDQSIEQVVSPAAWSISIEDDTAKARQPFTFSLSAGMEGETYIGIAFYSPSEVLGVAIPFPAPLTVGAGGVTFTRDVVLEFRDCATVVSPGA